MKVSCVLALLIMFFNMNRIKSDILRYDVELSIEQLLSDCIQNITETYFDPNLPIALQTPAMGYPQHDWRKNYGDLLQHTLHDNNHSPQVTLGYKDIEYAPNYFLRTVNVVLPGAYVLLVAKPLDDDEDYLIEIAFHRFFYDTYNPKGKFIIALNYFPQDYKYTAQMFFYIALIKGFIDVIILIPKKTYRKSVAHHVKQIDIYGWTADEQNEICSSEINKINHLDTWDIEMKTFITNSNLFPIKKMTDMKYCEIHAFLGYLPPFIFEDERVYHGSFAELILEFCFRSKCKIVPELTSKYSHIALPSGYELTNDSRECEYLYPYFLLDFTWFVPSGKKVEQWKCLFKVFTIKMWLLVIFTSIFGILFLWLLELIRNIILNDIYKAHRDLLSIALFGIGVNGRKIGLGYAIFLTLWLFYTLLISTAYQSKLFGLMIDPGEYPPIKTLEELKQSGLPMRSLVTVTNDTNDDQSKSLCNNMDCLSQISDHRNLSVFYSTYSGELIRQRNIYRDNWGKPKIVPLEEITKSTYANIQIMYLSCLIHDKLNTLLHRAWAFGLIHFWNKEYRQLWEIYHPHKETDMVVALKIWYMQGAFYILGVGLFFAIFIFTVEISLSPY